MDAFITGSSSFLPGNPIGNGDMESRLGLVGDRKSELRGQVLAANRIRSRYYAIDDDGRQTHLNDELAAEAVGGLLRDCELPLSEIGLLATGTTIPDLVMPGFASMVHGRLADYGYSAPLEILSASGVCVSGVAALRHAVNAVKCGAHQRAIACASELASPLMRGARFDCESEQAQLCADLRHDFQNFNAEFLRWMLSDGAGAVLVEDRADPQRLSLRVDWIDITSYAHLFPTCMYLGTNDSRAPGVGNTWWSVANLSQAHTLGMLMMRQDVELLAENIVEVIVQELERLIKVGRIDLARSYDWYLPHISSYFFEQPLAERMARTELHLPPERWFTNLARVGNVGAASFYLMLDEALCTGLFEPGHRILGMIPESGRFCIAYIQFTCVDAGS